MRTRVGRQRELSVLIPLLAMASAAWSCGRGSPAPNPERSAELLASASQVARQSRLDAAALHLSLSGVRDGAVSVGRFPWTGWRLEPETKVVVTAPGGKRLEFSFTQPLEHFADFDYIGGVMVEQFKNSPNQKVFKVEFGSQGGPSPSAEPDLPARLRPSLDEAEARLRVLEGKLVEVQHLIDRAADLLPRATK